jgi:hypothetical protein
MLSNLKGKNVFEKQLKHLKCDKQKILWFVDEYEIYFTRETRFLIFSIVLRTCENIKNPVSLVKWISYSSKSIEYPLCIWETPLQQPSVSTLNTFSHEPTLTGIKWEIWRNEAAVLTFDADWKQEIWRCEGAVLILTGRYETADLTTDRKWEIWRYEVAWRYEGAVLTLTGSERSGGMSLGAVLTLTGSERSGGIRALS